MGGALRGEDGNGGGRVSAAPHRGGDAEGDAIVGHVVGPDLMLAGDGALELAEEGCGRGERLGEWRVRVGVPRGEDILPLPPLHAPFWKVALA
jgi:hypothetical protein